MSRHTSGTTTTRRPRRFTPERDDIIDAAAVLTLGLLALLEFHTTFAGWNFLLVAALGMVLGLIIAHIANVLRQPAIVLIVTGVAAFFLLGGAIALHGAPGASPAPTTGTLQSLADGSVHGWRELLTTVPPIDATGPLLVLPYMLGLFNGLGSFALGRRTRSAVAPLLVPLTVFLAVIVVGSLTQAQTVPIATAFAIASLLWAGERSRRQRPITSSGSGRIARVGITTALFSLAAIGAYFIGPIAPGANAQPRALLRKHITPPFNIGNYPSPLGEFRLYAQSQKINGQTVGLKNTTLFTVTGSLPARSTLVFATLDNYNGTVWAATNDAGIISGKPNTFLRVGRQLDNPAPGPKYTMNVTVDGYDDYWLPTAGAVQTIDFHGPDAAADAAAFRYNLFTGSGILPLKVSGGDHYTATVAGISTPSLSSTTPLSSGADSSAGAFLKDSATALAGTQGSLATQVMTMARNLKSEGKFTLGDNGSGFEYYLPGHSVGRLTDFVKGVIPGVVYVGDDEQYAAAFALMTEQLGVPARVLLGVESMPADGVVRGRDVSAWVQVQATNGTWLNIPSTQFISTTPPEKKQLQQRAQTGAGSDVPPPAQGRPKSTLDDSASSNSSSRDQHAKIPNAGFQIPAWIFTALRILGVPVLALALVATSIVTAKSWRRRRRRRRGLPSTRLARGWLEATDHAHDLGRSIPARATRREQADELSALDLAGLALLTDKHIFGPAEITDADVDAFWRQVRAEQKRMSSAVSRARRSWAAVNPTTLLPTGSRSTQSNRRQRSGDRVGEQP